MKGKEEEEAKDTHDENLKEEDEEEEEEELQRREDQELDSGIRSPLLFYRLVMKVYHENLCHRRDTQHVPPSPPRTRRPGAPLVPVSTEHCTVPWVMSWLTLKLNRSSSLLPHLTYCTIIIR
ncbi:hypothetical protein O3P69_015697 [Scylla paramamosain]|uniref:Uncharacterized protein n=1 Tax=Scylla paramamosain TaxID=85552 RepID=A0AAW0SBZ0_SCYPA